MCGIVGYVGHRDVKDFLLEGLHRLEYRGYDSSGIAVLGKDGIAVRKRVGKVKELAALLDSSPISGKTGIGHTRWATHGEPSDLNSHPHMGGNGEVIIVHNGVIENYQTLKNQLMELGYAFRSATDTEVVVYAMMNALSTTGVADITVTDSVENEVYRRFRLPTPISFERISAEFNDGVLHVHAPKSKPVTRAALATA